MVDYSVTCAPGATILHLKIFGQNFLTDTNILQKIVDTAEIDKRSMSSEINRYWGLTEFLVKMLGGSHGL